LIIYYTLKMVRFKVKPKRGTFKAHTVDYGEKKEKDQGKGGQKTGEKKVGKRR
jgi:hypothetical protein